MPLPAVACVVPAFHVQVECGNSIPCLLGEFAKTLLAEHQVEAALKGCAGVQRGV